MFVHQLLVAGPKRIDLWSEAEFNKMGPVAPS